MTMMTDNRPQDYAGHVPAPSVDQTGTHRQAILDAALTFREATDRARLAAWADLLRVVDDALYGVGR